MDVRAEYVPPFLASMAPTLLNLAMAARSVNVVALAAARPITPSMFTPPGVASKVAVKVPFWRGKN
jgi:hypothetical protein